MVASSGVALANIGSTYLSDMKTLVISANNIISSEILCPQLPEMRRYRNDVKGLSVWYCSL